MISLSIQIKSFPRVRIACACTFDVFVKAASADDQTKNAVLLQATQCIFSPQSAGCLASEKEPEGSSQLVELVRMHLRNLYSSRSWLRMQIDSFLLFLTEGKSNDRYFTAPSQLADFHLFHHPGKSRGRREIGRPRKTHGRGLQNRGRLRPWHAGNSNRGGLPKLP